MRISRFLSGLLVVPLLLAADDPRPPKGWMEFSPKDQSFAVWLPEGGRRSERERTLTVLRQRIKINIVKVEVEGATYAASILRIPPEMLRKIPMKQRVEIVRDTFLNEVKGKVADEKDIKQGRVPGKEYTIEMREGAARLRVFALGGRLYRASIAGAKEQIESKDAETFLDSYKLPEKAAAPPAKGKDKDKKKGKR